MKILIFNFKRCKISWNRRLCAEFLMKNEFDKKNVVDFSPFLSDRKTFKGTKKRRENLFFFESAMEKKGFNSSEDESENS